MNYESLQINKIIIVTFTGKTRTGVNNQNQQSLYILYCKYDMTASNRLSQLAIVGSPMSCVPNDFTKQANNKYFTIVPVAHRRPDEEL